MKKYFKKIIVSLLTLESRLISVRDVPVGDVQRLSLRGVLGTAVVRVCDAVAGVTGLTEAVARREGVEYRTVFLPGMSHAGYYPGAESLLLKVLYNPATGKLLGAQAVGRDGVDKRIDVFATALTAPAPARFTAL